MNALFALGVAALAFVAAIGTQRRLERAEAYAHSIEQKLVDGDYNRAGAIPLPPRRYGI